MTDSWLTYYIGFHNQKVNNRVHTNLADDTQCIHIHVVPVNHAVPTPCVHACLDIHVHQTEAYLDNESASVHV